MQLKSLFRNSGETLPAKYAQIEINKIQYDSRKVESGNLFVAVKGYQTDGHHYLSQVAKQGAALAVVEQIDNSIDLAQVSVGDSRKIMSLLAYNFYAKELEQLDLIGITGTNGKTTCSYLIRSILQSAGISCGLAGTINYIIGSKIIDAWNTTPEAIDLYEMLARMQQQGNKACVLEVSSHALALNRVLGLKFKAAVFTNLSRDHMDFHKNMDSYFTDKKKLFSQLDAGAFAVTNLDDEYGARINGNRITFGTSEQADVFTKNWTISRAGTKLNIKTPAGDLNINSALIGEFNVYNLLSAVATGISLNISLENIKSGLEKQRTIPGRLELYRLKNKALAIIDYAHTPDAMEKALTTIRKITENNLITVFGCGGDRDKGKRAQMGKIAQDYADYTIITDDNPRTEDPKQIIDDIIAGIKDNDKIEIISDRKKAISAAIKKCSKGDVVLIAGKGHEKYQVVGKKKYSFDEAALIKEADNA